jgi:hypothetical protein
MTREAIKRAIDETSKAMYAEKARIDASKAQGLFEWGVDMQPFNSLQRRLNMLCDKLA